MPYSIAEYTGNGATQQYAVPFSYISTAHISAFVDGVEDTTFTWVNASLIQLTAIPANGTLVRIQRITPVTPLTTFVSGSTLGRDDLNRIVLQALYVVQEREAAEGELLAVSGGHYDAQSRRITNLADPVGPQDAATYGSLSTAVTAANAAKSAAQVAQAAAEDAADVAVAAQISNRFGLRNMLLNSTFEFNQRVVTAGTHADNTFFRDRWRTVGASTTIALASGVLTISAGAVRQTIPGEEFHTTGAYTLSWTGTAAANIDGTPISNGGNLSLTAGVNHYVEFSGGTVSKPQLEFGSSATTYEHRPVHLDRDLCRRFYQTSYPYGTAPGTATIHGAVHCSAYSTLLLTQTTFTFPVVMRTAPTVFPRNTTDGNAGSLTDEDAAALRGVSISSVTEKSFITYAAFNDFVPGARSFFHWEANADL